MKNLCMVLMLLALSFLGQAQTSELAWFENIEAAKEYATANQTDILMVFAGSDWCKPCIQFKKDILEQETFQAWGGDKLAILYLDFPARKKNRLPEAQTLHNENLAERFNKSGFFPNIVLMNIDEEILASPSFKGQTTEAFITQLEQVIPTN